MLPFLFTTHHDDGGEQRRAPRHDDEAVDEPRVPNGPVVHPHGFQGLLEPHLLLQHDALHSHGHGVDPGQHHEHGEAAVQSDHEAGGGGGQRVR